MDEFIKELKDALVWHREHMNTFLDQYPDKEKLFDALLEYVGSETEQAQALANGFDSFLLREAVEGRLRLPEETNEQ